MWRRRTLFRQVDTLAHCCPPPSFDDRPTDDRPTTMDSMLADRQTSSKTSTSGHGPTFTSLTSLSEGQACLLVFFITCCLSTAESGGGDNTLSSQASRPRILHSIVWRPEQPFDTMGLGEHWDLRHTCVVCSPCPIFSLCCYGDFPSPMDTPSSFGMAPLGPAWVARSAQGCGPSIPRLTSLAMAQHLVPSTPRRSQQRIPTPSFLTRRPSR
ncbi:hypothetical protein BDV96DRAFT_588341 [Lophiotrema nucula]|uniref:Uncharacterized protein n=1 Tax=Lophiotrema nucula TaxID=690887 RepID=A0A6A5YLP1_9PLEO|nr:hypothetical protein BDV96DRAFT_588341 [Lophiotrema nucula]